MHEKTAPQENGARSDPLMQILFYISMCGTPFFRRTGIEKVIPLAALHPILEAILLTTTQRMGERIMAKHA